MHSDLPLHLLDGAGLFRNNEIFGTRQRPNAVGTTREDGRVVRSLTAPASNVLRKSSFAGRLQPGSPPPVSPKSSYLPQQSPTTSRSRDSDSEAAEHPFSEGRQVRGASVQHSTAYSRRDSYISVPPVIKVPVRPSTYYTSMGVAGGGPGVVPNQLPSPTLENVTYLHIQETSSKRISTLDYLRKA